MKKLLIGIVCAAALLVCGCDNDDDDYYNSAYLEFPTYSNITAIVENVGTFENIRGTETYFYDVSYTAENIDCYISWNTCYSDASYTTKVTKIKSGITVYVKESDVSLYSWSKLPVYLYDKDENLINTYISKYNYKGILPEFTDVADNTHYVKKLYTDKNLSKEVEYPLYPHAAEFQGVNLYAEQFECSDKRYFSTYEEYEDKYLYLNDSIESGLETLLQSLFFQR